MKYYFLALGTLVVVCVGCAVDGQEVFERSSEYHAPPAAMMQRPGPMVDGPGPGVWGMMAPPQQKPHATTLTQLIFTGPAGMHVGWQIPDGFAENQVITPGRYDFHQGATYRLKLTDIPNRDTLNVYPSLQVYPTHPTTDAYLSHNCVPIEISEEDLDQVESNNFVTKVIYLPDPKFQELAIAGVETLVSTRLDPGVDPVAEADRRGTIMVVLRMGNMDLETPQVAQPMGPNAGFGEEGNIEQVSFKFDGEKGQHVPPMPIEFAEGGPYGVPPAMMMGGPGGPGMPAYDPVAGANAPMWGNPTTSTPIGLPGPPHLPYGGPATLKSHTVRNLTKQDLPKPVDNMLIDVKHTPGYSLPQPTKYIRYEEKHPVYSPGEVSYPNYALPGGQ
ncbi:MAG: hypothetical protein O2955_05255 [Planctomycetota bacterium]|nr:hypothetical protein [Planctomycetota bacterium]MDA1211901.1 hypothetical protein [Planctomycetota bacterium]